MRRLGTLVGVLAALLLVGGMAQAQDAISPSSRDTPLGGVTPFATLEVRGAFGSPDEQFGLYLFWTADRDEGGEKGFAVRRFSRSPTTGDTIEWATSFACPGLEAVIIDLEVLPMPLIDVPTVGRDSRMGPSADGVTYSLWSRYPTWPDAFGYWVQVVSNMGTPLAVWSGRFRKTLDGCWADRMPPAA